MGRLLATAGLIWVLIIALLMSDVLEKALGLRSVSAPATGDDRDDSKLTEHLLHPVLFMRYLSWTASRIGNRLPRLIDVRWLGDGEHESAFTVKVEKPDDNAPIFRFIQVGSALERRLGHRIGGRLTSEVMLQNDEVSLGSLEGAYRRCARTHAPIYEYAKYDLGDGRPVTFERLILPFADINGQVTHLTGMVLFDEECSKRTELT